MRDDGDSNGKDRGRTSHIVVADVEESVVCRAACPFSHNSNRGRHERKRTYLDQVVVYYESMERKLLKPMYERRCNGRLQTKRFTRLTHTGSVVEL
jgi:hypothetical protein